MNINIGVGGLLVFAFLAHLVYAYYHSKSPELPRRLPWVPIDVSKHRSFVNKTRDAGMFTEQARRVAILGANTCGLYMDPQRSFWNKSFSNGVMETMLTAVCPAVFKRRCPTEPTRANYDGGDATNDSCAVVYDGNSGPLFDFGDANTNVCSV